MRSASRQLRATGAVETRSAPPLRFWAIDAQSITRDGVALAGGTSVQHFAALASDLGHYVVPDSSGDLVATTQSAAGVETSPIAVVASSSDWGGATLLATTARIPTVPTMSLQRDIQFVLLADRGAGADLPRAWSACIGVPSMRTATGPGSASPTASAARTSWRSNFAARWCCRPVQSSLSWSKSWRVPTGSVGARFRSAIFGRRRWPALVLASSTSPCAAATAADSTRCVSTSPAGQSRSASADPARSRRTSPASISHARSRPGFGQRPPTRRSATGCPVT